jgi:glycine/D-amino acid oxidase-like deaminating enzyme
MLWVVGEDGAAEWSQAAQRMRTDGIEIDTVDQDELRAMAPSFDMSDVALGFWEPRGGYADPVTATNTLARGVSRKGGTVRVNTHVSSSNTKESRVTGSR